MGSAKQAEDAVPAGLRSVRKGDFSDGVGEDQ
jgi:hypothetical protein